MITTIQGLKDEAELLVESLENYQEKPTKDESKRIRIRLGEIKKSVTGLRAMLVEADKAGS